MSLCLLQIAERQRPQYICTFLSAFLGQKEHCCWNWLWLLLKDHLDQITQILTNPGEFAELKETADDRANKSFEVKCRYLAYP